AAGAAHFGSGWVWLVRGYKKTLQILATENGVNPLCFGQTALLGCDLWEHGYHGDFGIERQVFLMNFLDRLVNWENVASRL
ncbi:MAG: Fe-Mn family superoxide dismutase, partial [Myxococcota bacterium]|nr:Fe-Mn family superoxide dismutase [Myxococcota bacterium]